MESNQLQNRLSYQIIVILFFAMLVGVLAWIVQAPSSSSSNTRSFLSTLATGQASILAIVFSVTIVGVQLVATRYSSQLISVFTGKELWMTVGIFAISVSTDLFLLYTTSTSASRLHTSGVYMSVILAVGSIYALVLFVKASLAQSTPEGATNAFEKQMTPQRYLKETKQAARVESASAHPLRPLFHLIMRAISKDERVSAKYALEAYSRIASNSFEYFKDRNIFESTGRDVKETLFNTVAREHLPEIAEHAEQHGENDVVKDAVEAIGELGEQSLDIQEYGLTLDFTWGFRAMFRRSNIKNGEYMMNICIWRELGEFLERSVKQDRPKIVVDCLKMVRIQFINYVDDSNDIQRLSIQFTKLFQSLHTVLEVLLRNYGEEYEDEMKNGPLERSDGARAIKKWQRTFIEITEKSLKSELENGHSPIQLGNLRSTWKEICVTASESAIESYPVALCRAVIEFAIIVGSEYSELRSLWIDVLVRIKKEGHHDVINKAFEEISNHECKEVNPDPVFFDESEETSENYFHVTSLHSPLAPSIDEENEFDKYYPINTHPEYPEIVRELQKEVDEKHQRLTEY